MSIATLENELVLRAKEITGQPKLTRRRIMAWSSGPADKSPLAVAEGEIEVYIPDYAVWICFSDPAYKKK